MINTAPFNYLIIIAGPTAVGKTELAIKLAHYFNSEIISADSRQIYKEISIGTAKPNTGELASVKHHFIDHVSIKDQYNAGMFEKEVVAFLDSYFVKNKIAIMCGGSGMYIDAVCNGLDEFDEINPELRENINNAVKTNGLEWLQNEVKKLDPEYYKLVDIKNPARLQRALEVCLSTGKPYSERRLGVKKERNFKVVKILLNTDRRLLYERINKRVDKMMEQGLLNEVKSVFEYRHLKALQTVGYNELFEFLEGKINLEEAVDAIKQNSRRYAKRQLTWFNKNGDYTTFEQKDFDKILDFVTNKLA